MAAKCLDRDAGRRTGADEVDFVDVKRPSQVGDVGSALVKVVGRHIHAVTGQAGPTCAYGLEKVRAGRGIGLAQPEQRG